MSARAIQISGNVRYVINVWLKTTIDELCLYLYNQVTEIFLVAL